MWPRCLIIISLVFVAYASMLPAHFKTMDDRISIVENPAIRSSAHLDDIFKQGFFRDRSYYRPLVNLSFFIEYQLYKLNSFFYNLDNLLLHAANALLVFAVASILLGSMPTGFWVGVLFAIHPVHWEAVCNVPGRAIILCAFFVLNAFLFFLLFEKRKQWFYMGLSLLFFALALLSKESAGIFPGVLALYLWSKTERRLSAKIKLLIPYAVVIVIYLWWRHYLGITQMFQSNNQEIIALGFLTFLRSVITHVRVLILPIDLHFDRGLSFFNSFTEGQAAFTVIFWIIVGSVLCQWRQRISPFFVFLILWFALELLPVSQLMASIGVQAGMISTAEHFLYLPAVPFMIAVVFSVRWLYERNQIKKWLNPIIFKVGIGGVLVLFLLIAIEQSFYARNEMSMLRRSLQFEPRNARVEASMGLLHVFNNDFATGQKYFQAAVDAEPLNVRYRISLGTSLCDQGQWIECLGQYVALDDPGGYSEMVERQKKMAIKHIDEELAQGKIYNEKGWFILGIYYSKIGKMDEAIKSFDKTIELHPGHGAALMNRGSLYEAKQEWPKAIDSYSQLLQSPEGSPFQKEFAQDHLTSIGKR